MIPQSFVRNVNVEGANLENPSLVFGFFLVDILPALKGEDSPREIFRLCVSSGLTYAFAWAVETLPSRNRLPTRIRLLNSRSGSREPECQQNNREHDHSQE